MGADGPAIKKFLSALLLHPRILPLPFLAKPQFEGNRLLAEIAFADEQRDDEDAGRFNIGHNVLNLGFLFPESLAHLAEHFSLADFGGVLKYGGARLRIERRAVAEQHQGGGGEVWRTHADGIAEKRTIRNDE